MARKDYLNNPIAPSPNSIVVACSALVRNGSGKILLIRRTDNGYYALPGGQLEPGETTTQCAIRETREESGFDVKITGLIGIFSNPSHIIEYDDGEVRQEFSICFHAVSVGGARTLSDESSEVTWVESHAIENYHLHPSTLLRIKHGLTNKEPYYN